MARLRPGFAKGDRVLVRSNADEPLVEAVFERYEAMGAGRDELPVVRRLSDGVELYCAAIVVHDTEDMRTTLSFMSPRTQWKYLAELERQKA